MGKCKPAALLRQKLTVLKLELEDRTTSIQLVNEDIQKEERGASILQSELTDRSRTELEDIAAQHKAEREELLQAIQTALAAKKDLAAKIQSLLDDKRQQEADASTQIESIRRANQAAISAALATFRDEETSRTDTFLAQQANKIKQQTIQALEPEVRSIMQLHREATASMRKDEEKEVQEMTATLNLICQQNIESYRKEAKREHDRHVAEIQEKYNDRSSAMFDEHTISVSQLRDQISLSKEARRKQQNECLQQLTDRHSSELLEARADAEGRLSKLRRQQEQEVDALKAKSREELQAIANDLDQHKADFEKDVRNRVEKKRSTRVRDAENGLMQQREAKMEEMIRNSQTDLVRCERSIREETARREKIARSEHLHVMKRIRGDTRQQQEHLGSVSDDNKQLQSRKMLLEKDLKSVGDAKEGTRQLRKDTLSKAAEMATQSSVSQAAIKAEMKTDLKRHEDRIQCLKVQIAEGEQLSKINQVRHEEWVRSIANGHEKALDELDAKARAEVSALDERHAEIERELEDMSTRVEHQQTMLLRYTEDQKEDRGQRGELSDNHDVKEKVERTKKRGPARIRRVVVLKTISRNNKSGTNTKA